MTVTLRFVDEELLDAASHPLAGKANSLPLY